MLETEMVMYKEKLSSLDTKHDIQFCIIHNIYRKVQRTSKEVTMALVQ